MKISLKKFISLTVILTMLGVLIGSLPIANAVGSLSSVTDELSRLKAAETSVSHIIQFTIVAGLDQTSKIQLDTSDFTLTGTVVVKDDTSSVCSPTITSNIITLGGTCTIGTGSVVEITGLTATNPAVGSYTITINTDPNGDTNYSDGDTGGVKIDIIDDDQVSISGTVSQSISFSIEAPIDNGIGFGTLSTTAVRYPTDDTTGTPDVPGNGLPIQLKASTNSSDGVTISARSEGSGTVAGLYKSVATAHNIVAVASNLVVGTEEKYGVYVKNAASYTIDPGFDNNGSGDLAITYNAIAIASADTVLNNATLDVVPIASISGSTPAGSYADALTFLCTGNF